MQKKARLGVGALVLMGVIYTVLGAIFAILGASFLIAGEGELRLTGRIFLFVGSLFFILGVAFLVWEVWKKKRAEQMMAAGRYVWAEVVDCVPNTFVSINHRHPYQVVARYVDGRGNHHIFKSRSLRIYRDPGLTGKKVKIYYADDAFRHYYMDVDPILPQYIVH